MRAKYAREAISCRVENSNGDENPSVHSFPIERKDDEGPVLGCTVEIPGHDHIPQQHRIFADMDGFYRHLCTTGVLFQN
jgi:hypothetical protein